VMASSRSASNDKVDDWSHQLLRSDGHALSAAGRQL
jgi:hypothetical protein